MRLTVSLHEGVVETVCELIETRLVIFYRFAMVVTYSTHGFKGFFEDQGKRE